MSQTKVLVGIFVLFLLALPLASAEVTDYTSYYPFEYTNVFSFIDGSGNLMVGADGIVVAIDNESYNYGWNGSYNFDGSNMKLAIGSYPNAASLNSVGSIYRVNVYKKALTSEQALASYIQGLDDFKLIDSTVSSSPSASAGASVGGGGGY